MKDRGLPDDAARYWTTTITIAAAEVQWSVRSALALVLAGCWSGTQVPAPPPPGPVQRVAPAPREPDPPRYSVWSGSYLCSQGVTAVQLRIVAAPDGSARATFEFGPHADNPNLVARGSYQLTGALFVDDAGLLQLKLAPDHWIDQPPSYIMVGLSASSDAGQRVLRGKIENTACDWIEVVRKH